MVGGMSRSASGFAGWMIDLLLPRTDAGVAVQAIVVTVLAVIALALTWRNRDLRLFAGGLAMITYVWMALRTVH